MSWLDIFKLTASITSGFSLAAFLAALYIWQRSKERERSVVNDVRGAGIVNAETVVHVLTQFTTDNSRIIALEKLLGYDRHIAQDVLTKVKPNIDAGQVSLARDIQIRRRLTATGTVLIILAALAIGGYAFNIQQQVKRGATGSGSQLGTGTPPPTPTATPTCREFSIFPENDQGKAYLDERLRYLDWDDQPRAAKYNSNLDLKYQTWGGPHWEARLDDTVFTHAPNGNFVQAHTDLVIRYLDWDHKPMTATIARCVDE